MCARRRGVEDLKPPLTLALSPGKPGERGLTEVVSVFRICEDCSLSPGKPGERGLTEVDSVFRTCEDCSLSPGKPGERGLTKVASVFRTCEGCSLSPGFAGGEGWGEGAGCSRERYNSRITINRNSLISSIAYFTPSRPMPEYFAPP